MKNTALTHIHESLGAKLVPFAGYNMPVQYEGVNISTKLLEPVLEFSMFLIWENFS